MHDVLKTNVFHRGPKKLALSSIRCVWRDAKNDNPYLSGDTYGFRSVVAIPQEHHWALCWDLLQKQKNSSWSIHPFSDIPWSVFGTSPFVRS